MDTPESPSPAPVTHEELRQTCAALQSQIVLLLFALLLISGTVGAYLYVQDRWTNRELQNVKSVVLAYQQKTNPQIHAFLLKLADYGKTHPDFTRIVEKYRLNEVYTNAPQQ